MEKKWPVLRYCENHWKVCALATSIYSQWYQGYRKKMLATRDEEPARKKARTVVETISNPSSSSSESDTKSEMDSPMHRSQIEGTSDISPSQNN